MQRRLPGLDGIRAISIALVIWSHVSTNPIAQRGVFGVAIFFVLSGFLITYLLCKEEETYDGVSLPLFYARRGLRILPPALACIAVVCIAAHYGYADVRPHEALAAALFVRNYVPGGVHLGHFWSLAIEEQFYLCWPLLFVLLRSNGRRLWVAASLVAIAPVWRNVSYRLAHGAANVNSGRTDIRYDCLLMGCCLALLMQEDWYARIRKPLASRVAAALALACTVAGCLGFPFRFVSVSVSLLGTAALIHYAVVSPNGVSGRILNAVPVAWLGRASYSLYLWQQLFCEKSRMGWLGLFPQNVVASLLIAALSMYAIERPFEGIRSRLKTPFSRARVERETYVLASNEGYTPN